MTSLSTSRDRLRFDSQGGVSLLHWLWGRGATPAGLHRMDRSLRTASVLAALVFLLLAARLFYLQVILGDQCYTKSTNNFEKKQERPAVRGQVRDQKGRVVAENRPAYAVYITPRYLTEDALQRLRKFLELTDEQFIGLRQKIASRKGLDRFHALLAFDDISRDQMAMLESEKMMLSGVEVGSRPHRSYPHGPLAAHLVGYLGQLNTEELTQRKPDGYRSGDYIGRSGLERLLEPYLRGVAGYEKYIVDARGQRQQSTELARLLGSDTMKDAVPGHNVVLTLDLELQKVLERALSKKHSAAAVAVEVETGRILAIGSHPGPDPNLLTGRLTRDEWERLNTDPFRPLLDKSLRENYYPGSTFKIVPALAALEERLVNPEEKVVCRGRYDLGKRAFHCMKSHGPMTMHDALVQSCNVYFYHLAEKVGAERMARVAHQFGFGRVSGVGLGEVAGFVPTMEYYRTHGGFRLGDALNTALGQGSVKLTVLQLAMAYAALANGGKLFQPLIIDRVETPQGLVVEQFSPRLRNMIDASPESLERLRRALHGVVNDQKGTSFTARVETLDVAGKSGTAQVRKNKKGEASGWDTTNDHAWFAGFAPSRRAKIAVAVLVEHGGLGGHVAAPVAMEIIRGYFDHVAPELRARYAMEGLDDERPRLKTALPTASGVQ